MKDHIRRKNFLKSNFDNYGLMCYLKLLTLCENQGEYESCYSILEFIKLKSYALGIHLPRKDNEEAKLFLWLFGSEYKLNGVETVKHEIEESLELSLILVNI